MSNLMVTCPTCSHEVVLPGSAMGKSGKCKVCGVVFEVTSGNARPVHAPPEQTTVPLLRRGAAKAAAASRIESMDQLRGYAIFGMILVNALGNFDAIHWTLHHQRSSYSYPDTIAPLFVFVVGMGFRLSMMRRIKKDGPWKARLHAAARYLTLFVVAVMFYGPNYRVDWWDALTDIALCGLITLPVISLALPVRAVAAFLYLGLYMFFFLGTPYGEWLHHRSMNGGPLSPLSSAFALLFGTIAYDLLDSGDRGKIIKWSLAMGIGLVVLSLIVWRIMPWDFETYGKDYGPYWAFAKRWMAAPFQLLSTGLAMLAFLAFYLICDVYEKRLPHLTILGENPLVIYLVQYALFEMNGSYVEEWVTLNNTAADLPFAILSYLGVYWFCYAVARRLHSQGYIIKL